MRPSNVEYLRQASLSLPSAQQAQDLTRLLHAFLQISILHCKVHKECIQQPTYQKFLTICKTVVKPLEPCILLYWSHGSDAHGRKWHCQSLSTQCCQNRVLYTFQSLCSHRCLIKCSLALNQCELNLAHGSILKFLSIACLCFRLNLLDTLDNHFSPKIKPTKHHTRES